MASGNNIGKRVLSGGDDDLTPFLIHYGERVHATNDSLIDQFNSENYALSRYGHRNLFPKTGLVEGRPYQYQVKKFLYGSTAFLPDRDVDKDNNMVAGKSRWLGYVAAATDEGKVALGKRDILVVIRGTLFKKDSDPYDKSREAEIDIDYAALTSASEILGDEYEPQVHKGWYLYYTTSEAGSTYNPTSLRDQILNTVKELVEQYKDESEVSITLAGYSMGSPLVTLAATDIVYNGFNKSSAGKTIPVTVFAFASPRLGDKGFAEAFSALENLQVWRVRNKLDPVPDLPTYIPIILPYHYEHVGTEIPVDASESQYLTDEAKSSMPHELQLYLHAVSGFDPKIHELVLINKHLDALKEEYRDHDLVNWWVERNNSMVQLEDGSWVFNDHESDDE